MTHYLRSELELTRDTRQAKRFRKLHRARAFARRSPFRTLVREIRLGLYVLELVPSSEDRATAPTHTAAGTTWSTRVAYRNPFPSNGCGPLAVAHAAQASQAGLERLCADMQKCKGRNLLLDHKGTSYGMRAFLSEWLGHADIRLREVERIKYAPAYGGSDSAQPRTTLLRWATTHRSGTWIVFVRGHVVTVRDGTIWGYGVYRSVVQCAIRVEPHEEAQRNV